MQRGSLACCTFFGGCPIGQDAIVTVRAEYNGLQPEEVGGCEGVGRAASDNASICIYIYIYIYILRLSLEGHTCFHPRTQHLSVFGVHKGGFSKGGFSNLCVSPMQL